MRVDKIQNSRGDHTRKIIKESLAKTILYLYHKTFWKKDNEINNFQLLSLELLSYEPCLKINKYFPFLKFVTVYATIVHFFLTGEKWRENASRTVITRASRESEKNKIGLLIF